MALCARYFISHKHDDDEASYVSINFQDDNSGAETDNTYESIKSRCEEETLMEKFRYRRQETTLDSRSVQMRNLSPDRQQRDYPLYAHDHQPNGYLHDQQPNGYLHDQQPNGYLHNQQPNGYLHDQQTNGYLRDQQPNEYHHDQQQNSHHHDQQQYGYYQDQQQHGYQHDQQPNGYLHDQQQNGYGQPKKPPRKQFDQQDEKSQRHQQSNNDQRRHQYIPVEQYPHLHQPNSPAQSQFEQSVTQGQKKMKQHTDWNGVLQDLFGMELPQPEDSTHESTSSGVASDVTSVYFPTPTMTTFKAGEPSRSAKSNGSHDSGTRSASASGSPKLQLPSKKIYPTGTRTSPAQPPLPTIPRNARPLLGKNTPRIPSPFSSNGYHQMNDYSASRSRMTPEMKQPKENKQKLLDQTNCIQCNNNNNMQSRLHLHQKHTNSSPIHADNPAFYSKVDFSFINGMKDEQLIELYMGNKLTHSPVEENNFVHERRKVISPPLSPPPPPPGHCRSQSPHHNNYGIYLHSDTSSPTLKTCHNQPRKQHTDHERLQQKHNQQQNIPYQTDSKNNCDICTQYSHHILSAQPRLHEPNSSPKLQTCVSKTLCKNSALTYSQPAKIPLQIKVSDNSPDSIVIRSQTPQVNQVLHTYALVHTPHPESLNETRIKSPMVQTESPLIHLHDRTHLLRPADGSPHLTAGICNMPLIQSDKLKKSKNPLMASSGKRQTTFKLSPFEYLSTDALLKIFSHLSTDHLCRCAQVCHHWYSVVWENPTLWTSIVVNNSNIDIDKGLKYLTRRLSYNTPKVCMQVEKININSCCQLSDNGLQIVAKRCPELRYLDLQNCPLITNMGMMATVSRCVNLERLDVTGCSMVTCISLMESLIAQSASRHLQRIYLRYLDMTDCQSIVDEDLCITTSQCTQLLFLYLRRCPHITDLGVTYIANNCSSLRELSLSDCNNITDLGMRELAKLRENLRYLSVAKCEKISDQGIIHIAKNCSKLRYLNVRGCQAFSDTGLEFLARNCPRLRSLDIGKCDITDDGLYALSMYCPNLRKLGVKSCDAITDKGIVLIAYRCSSLQQLHVQDCCLSLDAYAMVRKYCKSAIIEHTNPAIF